MASRSALDVGKAGSANKENHPPKAKPQISINALFNKQHHRRHKADHESRSVLAPSSARVSKHYKSSRDSSHPVYRNFARVANEYRDGMAESLEAQLEPVYASLIARVDQLDVEDQSGSKAEIDALLQQQAEMSGPLSEERMTVQSQHKDGRITTKEIKLGDTIAAFQKLVNEKRTQLQTLLKELKRVEDDIDDTKQAIMDNESGEVKKANAELQTEIAGLVHKADRVRKQTLAEIDDARKEDKASTREATRKLKEFMENLD